MTKNFCLFFPVVVSSQITVWQHCKVRSLYFVEVSPSTAEISYRASNYHIVEEIELEREKERERESKQQNKKLTQKYMKICKSLNININIRKVKKYYHTCFASLQRKSGGAEATDWEPEWWWVLWTKKQKISCVPVSSVCEVFSVWLELLREELKLQFIYIYIYTISSVTVAVSCRICLLVGCLTSQQHATVSQGRICSDKFTCCHTKIEAADQNFLPHPVTVYWHRADQSQHWPYNARCLAG